MYIKFKTRNKKSKFNSLREFLSNGLRESENKTSAAFLQAKTVRKFTEAKIH